MITVGKINNANKHSKAKSKSFTCMYVCIRAITDRRPPSEEAARSRTSEIYTNQRHKQLSKTTSFDNFDLMLVSCPFYILPSAMIISRHLLSDMFIYQVSTACFALQL